MSDIRDGQYVPVEAFYRDPDSWQNGRNSVVREKLELHKPTIDIDTVNEYIAEAAETWDIIRDPETDKPFEIAVVNAKSTSDDLTVFSSTYTSAISNNVGNLVEFAQSAAFRPADERRVYVASLGNGGSTYFEESERKYIRETGRLTFEHDGETVALGTIRALARALTAAELLPNRVSGDSAGAALDTALMATLPADSITHAYFKGRTNLKDHSLPGLLYGMFGKEQLRYQPQNRAASTERLQLTPERIAEAKVIASRIYDNPPENDTKTLTKLYTDATGFRFAKNHGDPAVQDTCAALNRQPADITFHCSERDPLYSDNKEETVAIVADFIGRLNAVGRVTGLLVPGTHSDHAPFPALRAAAENYAFAK